MTRSSGRSRRLVLLAALVFFAALLLELGSVQAQSDPVAPSVAAQGSELWSATMRVGINTRLLGYSSVPERTAGALNTRHPHTGRVARARRATPTHLGKAVLEAPTTPVG